ncbi:MAG: HTTM domain-containing protein [Chloroflexota bacterium]
MCQQLNALFNSLSKPVDILPLVIFRVAFGLLMIFSTVRFMLNGWVHEFYVEPVYHFTYLGFAWVQPLPLLWMYGVFVGLAMLSVLIAVGAFYRISITTFFLLFTYVELIDKTYYLNHYYFISVMSLLMIVLPLHRKWAVDSWLSPHIKADYVPAWTLYAPRLMLGIVYFYAGLAKLTPDWLLGALPLRIWLPANATFPVIGKWFDYVWVAYAMSWAGALYDLSIGFLLSWRRTRPLAYSVVIGFHLMTTLLFNIGVFPWVMIACTLIFFDGRDWRWLAQAVKLHVSPMPDAPKKLSTSPLIAILIMCFFLWQLLMPLRHLAYPGNHLWTNEGYRFAWHVMLVEKNGTVIYRIEDPDSERFWVVFPDAYLTRQQEQQMSFQPDMILQFAHFLVDEYAVQCECQPEVYADTYVSFNRRAGQPIILPNTDLANEAYSWQPRSWIMPLHE